MSAAANPVREEPAIDPDLPIVDPHHHLWDILPPQEPHRFLLHEMLETIEASGHNVTRTVFVECWAMYRADGPAEMRTLGEVEFVNGIAAMSASGNYGPRRLAAGIVGNADLRSGNAVQPLLEAQIAAGGGRFRGVRSTTVFSKAGMFGYACDPRSEHAMLDPGFRDATKLLARMGLTLDVWCFHTQLHELIDLASHCPDTTIILDHIGTPESQGDYAGREREAREEWHAAIVELARRPNVMIKLGGIGMDVSGSFGTTRADRSSEDLAAAWLPNIEACIETFGPERCMFESNYPPDRAAGTYGAIWNAFKRIASDCSESEKAALFSGTARRVYRLD